MKITFQLFALTILLAACSSVPSDAQLRHKLIGTWIGPSDNLEMTMSSDGSYVSKFTREGMNYDYEGTWKIKDGFLITTLTANNSTNAKHTMHIGSVESFRIVHVDDQELIDEVGDCRTANCGMAVYTNHFEKLTK
jgi:hypothetical protein